jgi:hypothetical protein
LRGFATVAQPSTYTLPLNSALKKVGAKKMRWIVLILLSGNIFFIYQTYFWQQEAVDQLIATADVENMFLKLEHEIDYDKFVALSSKFPNYAEEYDLSFDKQGIYKVEEGYKAFTIGGGHTLIIFKNGRYVGSRLKDVPALGPWLVGLKYF